MAGLVTLDDSAVSRLLADPSLMARLPAVAQAGRPTTTAGGCWGCSKNRKTRVDTLKVKRVVARLPDDQLAAVKRFLGAETLRIIYAAPGGAVATVVR